MVSKYACSTGERVVGPPLYDAAESVSEIVGCTVEATIDAIQEALEKYVEQKESAGEDIFYSLHEFTVIDD